MRTLFYFGSLSTLNAGLNRYTTNLTTNLKLIKNINVIQYPERKIKQFFNENLHENLGRIKCLIRDLHPSSYLVREAIDKNTFKLFYHDQYDIIHFPNNYFLKFKDKPTVLTIHDLSWIERPEDHPKNRVMFFEKNFHKAIKNVDAIITPSQYIKDQLKINFNLNENKIIPIWHGLNHNNENTGLKFEKKLKKFKSKNYFLHVGTIEPRKNIEFLIQNYLRLENHLKERFPLILVGNYGWGSNNYKSKIENLIKNKNIFWFKQVNNANLKLLIENAKILAYCSNYEGFGFPPLEALISKTYAIFPKKPPFTETIKNYQFAYNDGDSDDFIFKIKQILNISSFDQSIYNYVNENFRWEISATKHLEVYKQVLNIK